MVRTKNEAIANKTISVKDSKWLDFRSLIYPSILDNYLQVKNTYSTLSTPHLLGRDAELWQPLITIASLLKNNDILKEVNDLSREITEQRLEDEADSITNKFLCCIYDMILETGESQPWIANEDVYFELMRYDEEFDSFVGEQKKSTRGWWVGKQLKSLSITKEASSLKSINGTKKRGHIMSKSIVEDMAGRYGVTLDSSDSVTSVPSVTSG